ncbi:hypothetical protein [Streptomyces boninensis]|uniref:hypothetical protein n=1 Tax=Streptomyces boninensis TaxID=2039455 RepID=UPI003B20DDAC
MPLAICSLKWDEETDITQKVQYGDDGYHLVRFPYGAAESLDDWGMHNVGNGGGGHSAFPDARSGLIWPSHDGWGVVSALVFWAKDDEPSEYRLRFVRDPLGDAPDSTATSDFTRTGGGQFRAHTWQLMVHPDVPLGLKITARGTGDKKIPTPIVLAEFKLAIHTDVMKP